MDLLSNESSQDSILGYLPNNLSQKSIFPERDSNLQYNENANIEKKILQNMNLEHKNVIKMIDFDITRNNCGPFEFGVQFNAKFFLNIIREYYLKLNCIRLNLIINDRIIYIYGHYNQTLKIYTKLCTNYINSDLVRIIEGHSKIFRANFEVESLLKSLEQHNFRNKETLKLYFVFNKNYKNKSKKREKDINSLNPFEELQAAQGQFESEFNFEENAIPGTIIIETQIFKCSIDSNFAPLELSNPPKIPSSIFEDYIFQISIDYLGTYTRKMNPLSPLEIFCNHYICNIISKDNCENFLTYDSSDGIQFNKENAIKFCKNSIQDVDEMNLYLKMFNFTLRKCELDALTIINKRTSMIHFYAGKKEKFYYTKEIDQDGNITSAIILSSSESGNIIKDIEDCCLYSVHWKDWINYLKNILPKNCINELEKVRSSKEESNSNIKNGDVNASTHNKRKKKIKEEKKKSVDSNNSTNINNSNINRSKKINLDNDDENKENELKGLFLFTNDQKGHLKKVSLDKIGIRETRNSGNRNVEVNSIKDNPFG